MKIIPTPIELTDDEEDALRRRVAIWNDSHDPVTPEEYLSRIQCAQIAEWAAADIRQAGQQLTELSMYLPREKRLALMATVRDSIANP